jgi:hypothetical protein
MKNQVGQIDEVTIHVCDEGRRTSKYFFCQRNLLVHVRLKSALISEDILPLTFLVDSKLPCLSFSTNFIFSDVNLITFSIIYTISSI